MLLQGQSLSDRVKLSDLRARTLDDVSQDLADSVEALHTHLPSLSLALSGVCVTYEDGKWTYWYVHPDWKAAKRSSLSMPQWLRRIPLTRVVLAHVYGDRCGEAVVLRW